MLEIAGAPSQTYVKRFTDIYEIKFSTSANVWTLYHFLYYVCFAPSAKPEAEHRWVEVPGAGKAADAVDELSRRENLSLQPSVLPALTRLDRQSFLYWR